VSDATPRRNLRETLRRWAWWFIVTIIVAGAVALYLAWWRHYQEMHPRVAWAQPWMHVEEHPLDVALLWREEVLRADRDGEIHFSRGNAPFRVAKGDVLAVIGGKAFRAPGAGYFVPALDGKENSWLFGAIWEGDGPIPSAPQARFISSGSRIKKGDPLGKFLPMPQDLRFVAYVTRTPAVDRDVRRNVLSVRTGKDVPPIVAVIRTAKHFGVRTKVYCSLPVFPLELLPRRNEQWILEGAAMTGVVIPQGAVTVRNMREGVFLVTGSSVRFQEVTGLPISERRFLVTEGLVPGALILLSAEGAREGRVKLW